MSNDNSERLLLNFWFLILFIDLFEENIELSMELVQHMEDYLQAEIQVNIFMFELKCKVLLYIKIERNVS